MRDERLVNKSAEQFSTTDAHGLTQMGEGFSTEGNKDNKGAEEGTADKRSSALIFWQGGEGTSSH